jgi:Protein of unknown function (DUF4232)
MTSSASLARGLAAAGALTCSALLAAACGSSSSTAASPGTKATVTPTGTISATASSPSGSAATTPSGPQPCPTSALQVSVATSKAGAAAGSSYYPIEFTNASGTSCTLYGYPGVSFVTGTGGGQIGAAATRNPGFAKVLVTVAPGQTVHAELQVADAQNYPPADCGLVTAHWLKIYPPNQTTPLYVSFTARTCSMPKTILSVETVQSAAS